MAFPNQPCSRVLVSKATARYIQAPNITTMPRMIAAKGSLKASMPKPVKMTGNKSMGNNNFDKGMPAMETDRILKSSKTMPTENNL